jgi:hypothetical protein
MFHMQFVHIQLTEGRAVVWSTENVAIRMRLDQIFNNTGFGIVCRSDDRTTKITATEIRICTSLQK